MSTVQAIYVLVRCLQNTISGYTSTRTVLRQDYAGRDVTSYLGHLLTERGHYYMSTGNIINTFF